MWNRPDPPNLSASYCPEMQGTGESPLPRDPGESDWDFHSLRTADPSSVIGPYHLLRRIGAGGMGEVYLAEHRLLRRRCAIKLIRSDKSANAKMLTWFEREVRATAQLTHWNTVQVYDYGCTSSGIFFYAMEYLQGLNLRQLVDAHGPMPPARVVYLLRQLCGALHEAACYGLVHRDIKPSNIFLTERGQMFDVVKLLDFGLVRPALSDSGFIQNSNGKLQGSPRFMCPEQAMGQKPDFRGDLYSLACVAYYLLTGKPPFSDENPVMLVVAHATATPQSLSDQVADLPADLCDIIMKCLNKRPEDRFPSARALLQALEQCSCADEWSWYNAEEWWLSRGDNSGSGSGDDADVSGESSETEPVTNDSLPGVTVPDVSELMAQARDQDLTFVCAQHDDESHC